MSDTARLTRGSIRGHLIGQTGPTVVGVAALMSVGLVNAYFIGRLGAEELAAVGNHATLPDRPRIAASRFVMLDPNGLIVVNCT